MPTDTSEKGLERLICTALTGAACDPGAVQADAVRERPAVYGAGWICGAPEDYDREYCVDLAQLSAFLRETQGEVADALDLGQDGPTRRKFLARLQGEITKRGVIDVLRQGRQARAAPHRPLLRHALAGQRQGRRALRRRTASASPASSATAATRRSARSTWACSSTACPSPPSS